MCKKLCVFVLILAMVSMANAADIRYMGSGPWETQANWQGGVYPGVTDAARFNWGDNTVTVSSAVGTVDRIQAGVDEPGTLHVLSGGTAQSGTWTGAGVAGNCLGTIVVDAGGTLNTGVITPGGGHLWVAMNDGGHPSNFGHVSIGGTVNVAGIIGLGTLNAVTPSGGIGTVDVLDGGLLALSNIAPVTSIQYGSRLTVYGGGGSTGLVTLPGDFVTAIQDYITLGRIVGVVVPIYDDFGNVIQTNIVAPEPATMILLGIGGLLIRRRKA